MATYKQERRCWKVLSISLFILIMFYGINAYAGLADDLIENVKGNVDTLIDRTSNIKGRTTNTLEEVQEIGDTIRAAGTGLTNDLIAAIQDGICVLDTLVGFRILFS